MALQQGVLLSNRYSILQEYARGGMSVVYLALDKTLNSTKAVKEIKKVEDTSDTLGMIHYNSLLSEAETLKKLDHPSLPRIFDVIETETHFYIVMDYLEGITLSKYLETTKHKRASQSDTIKWGLQIAKVLSYLHNQTPPLIYRDMKPGNVMLQPDGNIKVFDFGISRTIESGVSGATTALGSKGYAAPEQSGDSQSFDQRSDIFALGRTLYHLVTGHNPKVSPHLIKPIREWDASLSSGLEYIILKCTESDPNKRYQTVDELIYALEHYHEYDVEVVKKNKLKLSVIILLVLSSLFCFTLGGVIQLQYNKQTDIRYTNLLTQAQISRNAEDYVAALNIKGTDTTVYLNLLDVYKDDGVFTLDEERELKVLLSTNKGNLETQPLYTDLAFEVGKLYWFYYESDSEINIQGRINSIQWFNIAKDSTTEGVSKLSSNYVELGSFYKNIVSLVEEADDTGEYLKAFNSLEVMLSETLVLPELAQLENVRMVYTFFDMYSTQLYKDGVTQQQAQDLFDGYTTILKDITPTAEKTSDLKSKLVTQTVTTQKVINGVWKQGERD